MPALVALVLAGGACGQGERAAEETSRAAGDIAMGVAQEYPNAAAPTVLENDRMVVQTVVAEPAQWAGEHSHAGNQLAIALKGGTLTYREDGADRDVTYEDGQVYWVDAAAAHDHAAKGGPVEVVLVTMKQLAGGMATPQAYPAAPASVVFENDHVIVQRLVGTPGQWVGEHSHTGSQLGVILNGGTTVYREAGEETRVIYEDGQVFWVEATEAHDHATMGDSAIESLVITPKR
jgi:quercetin dioxygenase-like cupin family protein